MLVLEFKARTNTASEAAINEAILSRTKPCVCGWALKTRTKTAFQGTVLSWLGSSILLGKFNSQAHQADAERVWVAISRSYSNCKNGVEPVNFPKFKKHARSVEYKRLGWKLLGPTRIRFTEKVGIGGVRLIGSYDLACYPED